MSIIKELIAWYTVHKRDLPWRNTSDPYIIWLSEIILQQTRVDQGLPYFNRFSEQYPRVEDFASASEDEILKLWQGLGYYSRGRNMLKTAQMVMEEHAGYFPRKYDELLKLKGIGEYTAAAISSFSANEPKAVVDGNVFRVLARYFGIDEPVNTTKAKKIFTGIANDIIDKSNPSISNQAIMEFGALHCKPKAPLCGTCPVRSGCRAFAAGTVNLLPAKVKKTVVRNRYFNYIVFVKDDKILLNKRGPGDIWQNLFEFPLIETDQAIDPEELITTMAFKNTFGNASISQTFGPVKHVLSHQHLYAQFIILSDDTEQSIDFDKTGWFLSDLAELKQLAQPKLIFAFLENFPILKSNYL